MAGGNFAYSANYASSSVLLSNTGSSTPFNITGTVSIGNTGSVSEQFAPVAEDNTNGIIATILKPLAVNTYSPTVSSSTAYEKLAIVKTTAGNLYSVTGFNASTASLFFQVYNIATAFPAAAAPPIQFVVNGLDSFSLNWPMGRYFSTGIMWASSASGSYYVNPPSASFWVDLQYL